MNYASYSSINQSSFHMLFSKQIKLVSIYIKFQLKKIVNLILKKILYTIKLTLFYIIKIIYKFRFITRFIPYRIKITIRAKLLLYPRLTYLIKKFNNWVNIVYKKNKPFNLTFIIYFFIRIILIPLLNYFLNKPIFRKIIMQELGTASYHFTKTKKLNAKKNATTRTINTIELSPETFEIYKDFQIRVKHI